MHAVGLAAAKHHSNLPESASSPGHVSHPPTLTSVPDTRTSKPGNQVSTVTQQGAQGLGKVGLRFESVNEAFAS